MNLSDPIPAGPESVIPSEPTADGDAGTKPEQESLPEPKGAVESGRRRGFTVSMRVGLACTILAAVLTTAAIVYVPWVWVSRQNIENVVADLNKEIIKGVAQEIDSVFSDASNNLITLTNLFAENLIRLENEADRKQLFLSFLKTNATFSWISFGWPNGDFIGAQRETRTSIRYHQSIWDPNRKTGLRDIDFYNNENGIFQFQTTHRLEQNYYSPQRSWYKLAADSRDIIWTDVYVFATSNKPGLNTALALERQRKFEGVFSIAIELDRISRYLQSLQVAKHGTVFLINPKRELIAFQDPGEVTYTVVGKDQPQLKPLAKANDPRLRIADKAIDSLQSGGREFSTLEQVTIRDPDSGKSYFVSLAPITHQNWIAGTVIPEEDFLEVINRNFQFTVIAVLGLIFLTALLAVILSKWLIVNPLTKITAQTASIQNFELEQIQYVPSVISEVDQLSYSMEQMRKGLGSFQKYLPTDLVRTLISQGVEAKLGGTEKQVTIFFSDLVNFTHISESMPTVDLVLHLGDYLEEMSAIITGERGTIDKYIGDAIMAFWGAPAPNRMHAVDACRAALKSQRQLNGLRTRWNREGKPPFFCRIGINTGPVVVGNIGSREKMNYSVIGDSVNVASRLEALNKLFRTSILIGAETYDQAKQHIIARRVDKVVVYGKEIGLDIYEPLAMRDDVRIMDNYDWINHYEEGVELFHSGKYQEAIPRFLKSMKARGKDTASALFIRRCEGIIEKGTEAKQMGVTVMRSKS